MEAMIEGKEKFAAQARQAALAAEQATEEAEAEAGLEAELISAIVEERINIEEARPRPHALRIPEGHAQGTRPAGREQASGKPALE